MALRSLAWSQTPRRRSRRGSGAAGVVAGPVRSPGSGGLAAPPAEARAGAPDTSFRAINDERLLGLGRYADRDGGASGSRVDHCARGTAATSGMGLSPPQRAFRLHHGGTGARECGAVDNRHPGAGSPRERSLLTKARERGGAGAPRHPRIAAAQRPARREARSARRNADRTWPGEAHRRPASRESTRDGLARSSPGEVAQSRVFPGFAGVGGVRVVSTERRGRARLRRVRALGLGALSAG
jgi:hypothetical protein